jgi:hypothetical protein
MKEPRSLGEVRARIDFVNAELKRLRNLQAQLRPKLRNISERSQQLDARGRMEESAGVIEHYVHRRSVLVGLRRLLVSERRRKIGA